MSGRVSVAALALAALSCRGYDADPRVTCADLADRRVGKPEFWDALLIRSEPPVPRPRW